MFGNPLPRDMFFPAAFLRDCHYCGIVWIIFTATLLGVSSGVMFWIVFNTISVEDNPVNVEM